MANFILKLSKTIKSTFKVLRLLPFSNITAVTEEIYDEFFTPDSENTDNGLRDLKENFEKLITDSCKLKQIDRIFIFIDDLDRVEPQYALELMEAIKLFLDCKQCVFIMAIDHEVVNTALEKKYPNLSQTKRNSFFDKLIQVPFTVPINNYDISTFIKDKLKKLGVKEKYKEAELNEIVEILRQSVGSNPRSINRAINNYSLQKLIKNATSTSQDIPNYFDYPLFILTCMRYAYPEQFDELEQDPGEFIGNIESRNPSSSEPKYDEFLQFLLNEYGFKNKNSDSVQEEETKRNEAMEKLLKNLQFNSITSNTLSNPNSFTLSEQQEKFWKDYESKIDNGVSTQQNLWFTDSMKKTGGKHNYLSLNHNDSARVIELNLNRKSLRIIVGIYNKKQDSGELKEKLSLSLDERINSLKLKNTDPNTEIKIIDNTNHTGYIIKNNSLGLDLADYDDLAAWYIAKINEGLEILKSL